MKKTSKFSRLLSRFLVCIIFVLIGLIALKSNVKLRSYVYKNVFQNNLKFAKLDELYEKYFGSALPLTGSDVMVASKEKLEYENLEELEDGVKLEVKEGYTVTSLRSGIVIFSGEKENLGNTVIIEDGDGVEIWYSGLKESKLSMYDYLKVGDIIGSCKNELILEFKKDGKKVDYKKYL